MGSSQLRATARQANLGRCSGCSTVNRASQNMCRKRRTGALPAPPTILNAERGVENAEYSTARQIHSALRTPHSEFKGSVAQLAEQPVVCGKAEGANPFGSAILSERSSVFRAHLAVCQHLGTEAAGGNPAVPTNLRSLSYGSASHFKLLPWSNTSGIRLLSGTMQVEVLPAAPINHCQVVSK